MEVFPIAARFALRHLHPHNFNSMPRPKESNLDLLLKLPWWVSAAIGLMAFVALRWVIPAQMEHNPSLHPFAVALPKLAPLPFLFFALIAIGSFLFSKKRNRLVDEQTSLEKLRETSWKDFEFLVAEAYRRQGYAVDYSLGRGADGGVDLTLRRDSRKSLVQCKQWKVFSVGAPVIRQMFGLMTAEQSDEAIIITSGKFTRDAQDFAVGKPIQLIDGPQLLALVQSVQCGTLARGEATVSHVPFGDSPKASQLQTSSPSPRRGEGHRTDAVSAPACPSCGQPTILRTSKRGTNAGNQFWGCSTYPACKGTRKV
jgi:restriction system protein